MMEKGFSIQGAVMEVLQDLGRGAVHYAPRLITAILLVLFGWLIAKILEFVVGQVLVRARLEAALDRLGLLEGLRRIGIREVARRFLPGLLFWLVMLVFLQSAAEVVGLASIAGGIAAVFAFLPNLFSAFVILLLGQAFGQFVNRAVANYARESGASFARSLGNALSAFAVGVAVIIALGQLRVDTRILNILTIVIFSGLALGFGLAFGLGTRDTTRNLIAGFYARRLFGAGERLEMAGERGTLRAISATQTVLESDGVTVAIPNSTFLDQAVRRLETPEG
jgi:small-conductance mechanosensitive channel